MSDAMPIYRLHGKNCDFKTRAETRCRCPLHLDALINGVRVQVALETRKWGEAEMKAALIIDRKKGASKILKDAIVEFQLNNERRGIQASTQRVYTLLLKLFQSWCDSEQIIDLSQINLVALDRWQQFRKHVKVTTAGKELSGLNLFFGYCVKRGWIAENPAKQIDRPKVPDNEVEPYTESDKMKIMFACEQIGLMGSNPEFEEIGRLRVIAAIGVMRETGMRFGDVLKLSRDRVNGLVITAFTQKNRRAVRYIVTQGVVDALEALPRPIGAPSDSRYYFWNGGVFHNIESDMQRVLRRVYVLSGVKGAKNHRWRHTFISEHLAAGNSVSAVSQLVGITESVLLKHYAKYVPELQDRADEAQKKFHAFQKQRQANTAADLLLNQTIN